MTRRAARRGCYTRAVALVAQRRRATLTTILVIVVTGGCTGDDATKRAAVAADAAVAPADARGPSRAEELARAIRDGDSRTRPAAIAELGGLALRGDLTPTEANLVLDATFHIPPGELQASAIDALLMKPRVELMTPIEEAVPRLGPDARTAALVALARSDDPAAAQAILRLVEAHPDQGHGALFVMLRRHPHPTIFPDALRLIDHAVLGDHVVALAIDYCDERLVRGKTLLPEVDRVLARVRAQRTAALVDLLGCFPRRKVEKDLEAALDDPDPRIALTAVRSMLHVRARPPRAALERLAALPLTRAALYEALRAKGKKKWFPKKYRSQIHLAESVMVERLAEPDLLGKPPDELELVDVVAVDVGKPTGVLDHYVFRFRVEGRKKDMLGVAGPFRRKSAPTLDDHGATWSDLEPAGRRKPTDLVDARDVKQWWADEHEEMPPMPPMPDEEPRR